MIPLTLVTCFATEGAEAVLPLFLITPETTEAFLASKDERIRKMLETQGFKSAVGQSSVVCNERGEAAFAVAVVESTPDVWSIAALPAKLPDGNYRIDSSFCPKTSEPEKHLALAYGWGLACYRFQAFVKEKASLPKLVIENETERAEAIDFVESAYLARDLINLPANHLGPQELIQYALDVARQFKAEAHHISGERLISENYPAIFAVGKASTNPPGIVDLRWGDLSHPKVTLVGKGVTFDTGGLDIKQSAFMKLMKKDMGGAAVTLSLARLIMARKLPVRLRLLIPTAENSIAGNAFRPLDIIETRKGLTVEIGNTDAEGRLLLCDALTEADAEKPDLLIDCATLTGAARVALGTEIPAFFTPDESLADAVTDAVRRTGEPMWRLPLYEGYRDLFETKFADLNNASDSSYAGAITAALFLKTFVEETTSWLHVDMMAWNVKAKPGRPVGGEAQCLRALYELIASKTASVSP